MNEMIDQTEQELPDEQDTDDQGSAETGDARVLLALIGEPNLASMLADDDLGPIGQDVVDEFEFDDNSRDEWLEGLKTAQELASQVGGEKSTPWPGAANIKWPLVTEASLQFAARAYPAIVPGSEVVKVNPQGFDPTGQKQQRAERVGRHMSYQLLEEIPDWELETDQLLNLLPIEGCGFRKTFKGPGGPESQLVRAEDLVVHAEAKSLESAPRVTQIVRLYPHEIKERINRGTFIDHDYTTDGEDEDALQEFLEQHRRLDLDDDGYAEPYIVTVHRESAKVARIVARFDAEGVEVGQDGKVIAVKAIEYYTKYGFLPNPKGEFYDVGFGHLIGPINDAVNATINQLLDAGHLANVQGGFIGSGMRLKRGDNWSFSPGEWKEINVSGDDIRKSMVPLQFKEPSMVLFQLLSLLIDAAKSISSVKDAMTGEMNPNMTATAVVATIEQGQKVFSSIYKRIHRSLKAEFKKIYRLNRDIPPQAYAKVLDTQFPQTQDGKVADYQADADVTPVSDPQMVTETQRIARAEAMMPFIQDPDFDGREIKMNYMRQLQVDGPERFLAKPPPPEVQQQQQAKQQEMEAYAKAMAEAALSKAKAEAQLEWAKIEELETKKILNIAKAEAEEAGIQLDEYMARVNHLTAHSKVMETVNNARANLNRGLGQPHGAPGMGPVPAPVAQNAPPLNGAMGNGPIQ